MSIFATKSTSTELRSSFCTEFHPNRPKSWKLGKEIHLRPKVKYGFHCASFDETYIYSVKFGGHLLYGCLCKSDYKCSNKKLTTFLLRPVVKYALHYIDFLQKCSITLHGAILCKILFKSDGKFKKRAETLLRHFTLIFTELVIAG